MKSKLEILQILNELNKLMDKLLKENKELLEKYQKEPDLRKKYDIAVNEAIPIQLKIVLMMDYN